MGHLDGIGSQNHIHFVTYRSYFHVTLSEEILDFGKSCPAPVVPTVIQCKERMHGSDGLHDKDMLQVFEVVSYVWLPAVLSYILGVWSIWFRAGSLEDAKLTPERWYNAVRPWLHCCAQAIGSWWLLNLDPTFTISRDCIQYELIICLCFISAGRLQLCLSSHWEHVDLNKGISVFIVAQSSANQAPISQVHYSDRIHHVSTWTLQN